MEEKVEERRLEIPNLVRYDAVGRFKSVNRAITRGLVSPIGAIYPNRPFNNKGNTCSRKGKHSRSVNELKKQIYGNLKQRNVN